MQNVQGTPVTTQTNTQPATTVAQPTAPTAPTVYSSTAPTPYNPYGSFTLNTNLTGYQNNRTGIPYRPTGA